MHGAVPPLPLVYLCMLPNQAHKKVLSAGCNRIYSPHDATAPAGPVPFHYRSFAITLKTHHTRQDSSGRVISSTQRPLPGSTQHTTLTRDNHTHGGIRTRTPSKRAAAEPRFRPRENWDLPQETPSSQIIPATEVCHSFLTCFGCWGRVFF